MNELNAKFNQITREQKIRMTLRIEKMIGSTIKQTMLQKVLTNTEIICKTNFLLWNIDKFPMENEMRQ